MTQQYGLNGKNPALGSNQPSTNSDPAVWLRLGHFLTLQCYIDINHYYVYTLNNAGLFQPKFGSNMDKSKCWVKTVIKKFAVESES